MSRKYPSAIRTINNSTLKKAWNNSRDRKGAGGSPGIDNISPGRFREALESNFNAIHKKIGKNEYRFSKLKAFRIQKGDNKYRIICVPTVSDRLVQRVILDAITNPDRMGVLNGVSYGVLKGKEQGTHAAIDKAIELRTKYPWVLKTDVSAFFDNIPRAYLLKVIKRKLKRHSLVPLLEQIINCEIDERDKELADVLKTNGIVNGHGLRQGMPLSPLLANLVLGEFDRNLAANGIKAIRYVDDILVCCASETDATKAHDIIKSELAKIDLKIPELNIEKSKTEKLSPDDAVLFLGLEIYKIKNGKYAKRIPQKSILKIEEEVRKLGKYNYCRERGRETLAAALSLMENIPLGYKAAYANATNEASFSENLQKQLLLAKKELLTDIFSPEIFSKLDEDKLKFLGLV
jgi:RNA-directed DNA polymerase